MMKYGVFESSSFSKACLGNILINFVLTALVFSLFLMLVVFRSYPHRVAVDYQKAAGDVFVFAPLPHDASLSGDYDTTSFADRQHAGPGKKFFSVVWPFICFVCWTISCHSCH